MAYCCVFIFKKLLTVCQEDRIALYLHCLFLAMFSGPHFKVLGSLTFYTICLNPFFPDSWVLDSLIPQDKSRQTVAGPSPPAVYVVS